MGGGVGWGMGTYMTGGCNFMSQTKPPKNISLEFYALLRLLKTIITV